jgi:hypothetical protein
MDELKRVRKWQIRELSRGIVGHPECSALDGSAEADFGVRPKLKGKPPHRAQSGYGRGVGCGLPGALTE